MYPCPLLAVSTAYYAGGVCQITSGLALMAWSLVGTICPPAGAIGATLGLGLRKFGNRMVDGANVINPLPAATKIV